MGRKKIYTDEELKLRHRESNRLYRKNHPDRLKKYREDNKERQSEYMIQWRIDNPDYNQQYNNTIKGRAKNLAKNYKQSDILHNRGECTLTSEWIVDNIFNSKCHYCGETDWTKLGCDRINNELPHTPDNVVCCCFKCNCKRNKKDYEEFVEECMLK